MTRLSPTPKSMTEIILDPVCGMKVNTHKTDIMTTYKEQDYYFCAETCHREFKANPERYRESRSGRCKAPKTWWGRYLERVAKANEKLFGGRSHCCH